MAGDEFNCLDCKVNTDTISEYYMVSDDVWREAGMRGCIDPLETDTGQDGMLCIGCLEKRLKRELVKTDFTTAPLNFLSFIPRSVRLYMRLNSIKSGKSA